MWKVRTNVFSFVKFCIFFNQKNMVSTHTKDSCENNGPNLPDFEILYKKIDNFLQQVSAGNQKTKMMLKFFYFRIWFREKIG